MLNKCLLNVWMVGNTGVPTITEHLISGSLCHGSLCPVRADSKESPAFLPPHFSLLSLNLGFPMLVSLSPACAIYRLRAMAVSSSSWELPLVAVCQVTSTPDKEQNFITCAELIREAARLGACLAFLPEAFDFIARNPEETLHLSEPLGGNLLGEYTQLARYQGKGEGEVVSFWVMSQDCQI